MTLVADSGSTKTAWMEVDAGNMIVTEGLNPHFTTDEQLLAACAAVSRQLSLADGDLEVYFYGAGCGNATQRCRVETLLSAGFRTARVHVDTDMLGACRAVNGNRAGLVGILGTGSNVCYYDGRAVVHQPVSTGYILGDNGSANHVGRILLNDYLTQRMPSDIRIMFHDTYRMSDTQLIDAVYHQPHPNRFLASLAPFAVRHQDDGYCTQALLTALCDWVHGPMETLCATMGCDGGELNVVGGFAKAVEPLLRRIVADTGLRVGSVVADPIEGLRRYHAER